MNHSILSEEGALNIGYLETEKKLWKLTNLSCRNWDRKRLPKESLILMNHLCDFSGKLPTSFSFCIKWNYCFGRVSCFLYWYFLLPLEVIIGITTDDTRDKKGILKSWKFRSVRLSPGSLACKGCLYLSNEYGLWASQHFVYLLFL